MKEDDSLSGGAIAGIVIVGFVTILIIVVFIALMVKKRNAKKDQQEESEVSEKNEKGSDQMTEINGTSLSKTSQFMFKGKSVGKDNSSFHAETDVKMVG